MNSKRIQVTIVRETAKAYLVTDGTRTDWLEPPTCEPGWSLTPPRSVPHLPRASR